MTTATQSKPRTPGAEHTIRTFHKVWVAGTAGGFFTAFVRAAPAMWRWPDLTRMDAATTTMQFARHFYLLWFAAYFALSQLRKERLDSRLRKRDLFFDVMQSLTAFVAAYRLGLGTRTELPTLRETAFIASAAIGFICLLSLICFSRDDKYRVTVTRPTLNTLRVIGLVWSALLTLIIWRVSAVGIEIALVISLMVGHLLLLILFGRVSARAITLADQRWTLTTVAEPSRITAGSNAKVKVALTNIGDGWQPFPRDTFGPPLLVVKTEGRAAGPAVLIPETPKAFDATDGLYPGKPREFTLSWTKYWNGDAMATMSPRSYEIVAQFAGLSSDPITLEVEAGAAPSGDASGSSVLSPPGTGSPTT